MKNRQLRVINQNDIHAVFIWPADPVNFPESTVTIRAYTDEIFINTDGDDIWTNPSEGHLVTNIRSDKLDLLKKFIEDTFPHLTNVGHPTIDGKLFDDWITYVDQRGADIINNEVGGGTKVTSPSEIRNID